MTDCLYCFEIENSISLYSPSYLSHLRAHPPANHQTDMVTSHPDEDTEVEEITHLCHFALDMIDALISYNIDHPGRNLNLRVGINVGPVVAGVVGKKRFLYE
jgi:class 3 adenylate cyclase